MVCLECVVAKAAQEAFGWPHVSASYDSISVYTQHPLEGSGAECLGRYTIPHIANKVIKAFDTTGKFEDTTFVARKLAY